MQTTALGLPRLHGEQSGNLQNRLLSNAKRSVVFAPRNANTVEPSSAGNPFIADEHTQHPRPQSTPGASRSHPVRSETHSAAARQSPMPNSGASKQQYGVKQELTNNPASGDYAGRIEELQGENDALHHTIHQLHAKLLEKMRGANKVVGGGQFRVMTAAPGNATIVKRPADSSGCHRCSSYRKESSRLSHELDRLGGVNCELREYINILEQQRQSWISERESQRLEIAQLERDVSEGSQERALMCADRDLVHQKLVALERAHNNLQNELAEHSAYVSTEAKPSSVPERLDATTQTLLVNDNQHIKQNLELTIRQLAAAHKQANEMQKLLEGERLAHQQEKGKYEQQQKELELELRGIKNEAQILSGTTQQLTDELERRSQEMILREQIHIASTGKLTARIESLGHDCKSKEEIARNLATENDKLKQLVESLEANCRRFEIQAGVLMDKVMRKDEQICAYQLGEEGFKATIDALRVETSRSILDTNQLKHTSQLLETAEVSLAETSKELKALQLRIEALEVDIEERDQIIAEIQQAHTRTLERALDKTLRICLVAPTVNVHLGKGAGSRKISQQEEETVECCSQPSKQAIKESVEKDILPFFTSIMVERNQDMATQASGVPSDSWLQTLLDKMKRQLGERIETLFSAPKTAS